MSTQSKDEQQGADASTGSDFKRLLTTEVRFGPSPEVLTAAMVKDYQTLYDDAATNFEAFWDNIGREFTWVKPWTRVVEGQAPQARWFINGQLNITTNCLDRHVTGGRADKRALISVGEDGQEKTYTFTELLALTCQIANGLKSLGVKKGDRVIIYMPLTPEGVATMLACARIGAIHSAVYAGLGSGALRARIEDAGAHIVVTTDVGYRRGKATPLKSLVDAAVAGLDIVEHIVVWRRQTPPKPLDNKEVDFYELVSKQPTTCPTEVMDAEDVLFMLYTSGSTGAPKGCVYAEGGYMVGTAYYTRLAFDLKEDDIYWCMSDIGWIVGHSTLVYGPLANGTTILIREGSPDFPNPGIAWEVIEKYGVTKLFTAPTAIRMFMKFGPAYPKSHNLDSLRLIVCAGEPLNPEALVWAKENIGNGTLPICDNWWQTETAGPTIGTLISMEARAGRAGKPLPGYTVKILDRTTHQPVKPHEGGLLVLEGSWPQMFRTIWGDEERYLEYWKIVPPYYTAGDVATMDEDGYISVLGRFDDVLNVAGHRIGTADVESALVSHPAVAEAGVIGKPDEIKGESIKAFVTLKVGHTSSDELKGQLIEHVRRELGPIATPSELDFVTGLPKTRSGKIMRRVLKARELGQDPGDVTTIEE